MIFSFFTVAALAYAAWIGTEAGYQYFLGIGLPVFAFTVFILGVIGRVIIWGISPAPFSIPIITGQQRSLGWIKPSRINSPYTKTASAIRLILEVITFRPLLRNSYAEISPGAKLIYIPSKWLWLFSLAFHYSLLLVLIRHLRFFMTTPPAAVQRLISLDAFLHIGSPKLQLSGAILLASLLFLLGRRILSARMRYISLPGDYLHLFLLLGVTISGFWMRYVDRADVVAIKQLAVSTTSLSPVLPGGISPMFFVHITLLSVLLIIFPFGKLMHMAGILLSPTLNMTNNSRATHHVNPWNRPVRLRSYADYEDEFRDVMAGAGINVEKSPPVNGVN